MMQSSKSVPPTDWVGRATQTWSAIKPGNKRALYAWLFAVAVFAVGGLIQQGFASALSIKSVLIVASFVGIVAASQAFVVLVGGIDLSVPWVLNTAMIILMVLSGGTDAALGWAVPVALLAAAGIGTINGIGVAYLNIPAVVMTLAMNGVLQGLVLARTRGFSCDACLKAAPPGLAKIVHTQVVGIPGELLVWLGVAAVITVILNWTSFGRRVYALGLNPAASYLSAVRNSRLTVCLYALSGLFAGVAGILLLGYTGAPTIDIGDPYLFASIAAVVVGGIAITGGRGHYLGAAAGAITLTAITTLLSAKNMPDSWRSVIYGGAVIAMSLLYNRND